MLYGMRTRLGAFRSREPEAFEIGMKALNVGLDAVDEYVVIDPIDELVYVYLDGVEDAFVFDLVIMYDITEEPEHIEAVENFKELVKLGTKI